MEKAKLTQDQAEAFEKARRCHSVEEMIRVHVHETYRWFGEYSPLNQISLEDLIRALYAGYEVDSGIKVGDWVSYGEFTTQVTRIEGFKIWADWHNSGDAGDESWVHEDVVRLASENEIAKAKRVSLKNEIKNLPKGSLLVWKGRQLFEFIEYNPVLEFPVRVKDYFSGSPDGISPSNLIKILCRAEDRKDVN